MSDEENSSGKATIKVNGLQVLKTTGEGGSKLDFEEFKDKIANYFVQNKNNGADIAHLISKREDPVFPEPTEPDAEKAKVTINMKRYERQLKVFFEREEEYERNKKTLFSLIWENVSEETQDLIMSKHGYEKANVSKDPKWILKALHSIIEDFDDKKHIILSMDDQLEKIVRIRQGNLSVKDYIRVFRQEYKTLHEHGGSYIEGKVLKNLVEERAEEDKNYDLMSEDERKELRKKIAKNLGEEIETFAILKRADKKRFGNLQIKLKNNYLLGRNEYPRTVQELTKVLKNYEQEWNVSGERLARPRGNAGTALLQDGTTSTPVLFLKGTTGTFFAHVTCTACNHKGHYKSHCPVVNEAGEHMQGAGTGTLRDTPVIQEALAAARSSRRGNGGGNGGGSNGQSEVSSDGTFPFCFTNNTDEIDPNWLLLDSESNVDIFCNPSLVTDIAQVTNGEKLVLTSNGGTQDSDKKARFGDMTVWFNINSIANILSLSSVAEHFRVTMDTLVDNSFLVHLSDNIKLKFGCHSNGLYYCDTKNILKDDLHAAFSFFQTAYCNLQTVKANKLKYSKREIRKADEARQLSRVLGHPEQSVLERMIKHNVLQNCTVTVQDVKRATKIYGRSIPAIKGRSKRTETARLPSRTTVEIPKEIIDDFKEITLCIDFFYISGLAIFHAISRDLKHRYVGFTDSRSASQMLQQIQKLDRLYSSRGFRVTTLHADPEFEKIRDEVQPMNLIVCEAGAHVPEVERSTQTVKNGCRAQTHSMPYRAMPRIMIRALVQMIIDELNAEPARDGYKGATPRNIIDNLPHLDCNELKYEFGSYVQLHMREQVTNTMRQRTIDAIVLNLTSNGKYRFMSLETGHEVDGTVKEVLPLTDDIIQKVEEMGTNQGIALNPSRMLAFEWRPGQPMDNDDIIPEQYDNVPFAIPQATLPVLAHNAAQGAVEAPPQEQGAQGGEVQGAQEDENQGAQGGEVQGAQEDENQGAQEFTLIYDLHDDDNDVTEVQQVQAQPEIIVEEVNEDEDDEDIILNGEEEGASDDEEEESEERKQERQRRSEHFETNEGGEYGRGIRKKIKRKFSFLQKRFQNMKERERRNFANFAWQEYQDTGDKRMLERCVTGFVFAQLSAKEGRKRYGKDADIKLMEEFQQLLDYDAFFPRKADTLSAEAKKGAAGMINIIEEKTNRGHTPENPVLKGRSVFDGRAQRFMYTKEETASPTVSIDAFFLSMIIDSIEKRDVAMADIKGAYLNAIMDDEVIMKIIGDDVDIFCKLRPDFKDFVVLERGRKVLYVQLYKALYGCVKSALLWYEMFTEHLKEMGFEVNPYDMCVANAMIGGKQCTITWYVHDTKISHKDPKVVDSIIEQLEKKFGKMKVVRGLIHEFLGMDIVFKDGKESGKVLVGMKKHILKAMDMFLDDITRDASTPATPYLFKNRGAADLDENRAENFHSVTALLLFISRRSRPDIQTAIAYLCTRVAKPNEDDWKKLKRVLQYLRGTIDLVLTLGADDIANMQAWVDIAYAVHEDCKSHTGGVMSWGWGVVLSMCKKQKLNTKSSTEGEIVGVSDYLPNVIWGRMFLEAQGYKIKENTLYQDNQAAMKILKNGKASSGQKTKHIDARYFFIKDRCETEGIEIKYCPTEIMIADFFTKPLQGNLFKKLRDVVLGYVHVRTLFHEHEKSSSQERVSKNIEGSHCEELNDIHRIHGNDKENNNGEPAPHNTKVTWADIVKREKTLESINSNSH